MEDAGEGHEAYPPHPTPRALTSSASPPGLLLQLILLPSHLGSPSPPPLSRAHRLLSIPPLRLLTCQRSASSTSGMLGARY